MCADFKLIGGGAPRAQISAAARREKLWVGGGVFSAPTVFETRLKSKNYVIKILFTTVLNAKNLLKQFQ